MQAFLAECTASYLSQEELGYAATSDKSPTFQGLNYHPEHTAFKSVLREAKRNGGGASSDSVAFKVTLVDAAHIPLATAHHKKPS